MQSAFESGLLPSLWNAMETSTPTLVFTCLIAGYFAVAFIGLFHSDRPRMAACVRSAPSILTSLGVLGTFFGIFVGLQDFDVTAIDESVPKLLDGMKLAFVTSLMGMAAMLAFKTIQSLFAKTEQLDEEVGAPELLGALRSISEENRRGFDRLTLALVGDAEVSMATQLVKLRASLSDGLGELDRTSRDGFVGLREDFRDFAEKVAENNSKALIEALKDVVADFNDKITEQFGENFKQLNHAVGELLHWQENYKGHVETLTSQFEAARQGIDTIRVATAEIAGSTAAIPAAMKDLEEIMRTADHQIRELDRHLAAFAEMKARATEALPQIERNLEHLTASMRDGSVAVSDGARKAVGLVQEAVSAQTEAFSRNAEHLSTSLEAQERSYKAVEVGFDALQKTASQAVSELKSGVAAAVDAAGEAFVSSVEKQHKKMSGAIEGLTEELKASVAETGRQLAKASEEHAQVMQKSAAQHEKTFEQVLRRAGEELGKNISELDRQMQDELSRAVQLMGQKLGALAQKLVSDYAPLTDKLRRLVEVGRVG